MATPKNEKGRRKMGSGGRYERHLVQKATEAGAEEQKEMSAREAIAEVGRRCRTLSGVRKILFAFLTARGLLSRSLGALIMFRTLCVRRFP